MFQTLCKFNLTLHIDKNLIKINFQRDEKIENTFVE